MNDTKDEQAIYQYLVKLHSSQNHSYKLFNLLDRPVKWIETCPCLSKFIFELKLVVFFYLCVSTCEGSGDQLLFF